jgi:hypothetical protein
LREGIERFPVAFLDEDAMDIRLLCDHREVLVNERTRLINRLRINQYNLCAENGRAQRRAVQNVKGAGGAALNPSEAKVFASAQMLGRASFSFPVRGPATQARSTSVSASERTREQRDDVQDRGDRARPSWARGKPDQNSCAECKHREPVVGGPDLRPKRRVPAASRGIVRGLPRLPSQMLSQSLIPRDLLRSTTSHDKTIYYLNRAIAASPD